MKRSFRAMVVAAVAVPVLSACSLLSPQQTMKPYDAADGRNADLGGGAKAQNLLVVSEGSGKPGILVGQLTVAGDKPVTVTLAGGDKAQFTASAEVTPGEATALAPKGKGGPGTKVVTVQIASVKAQAGGLVDLMLAVPGSQPVALKVPVHTGGYYATLKPGDGASGASGPSSSSTSPTSSATPAP